MIVMWSVAAGTVTVTASVMVLAWKFVLVVPKITTIVATVKSDTHIIVKMRCEMSARRG